MINRILIRIKVVQMLYSYLLTRSEFKIDEAPETASRDRRYAYSAYIALLQLIQELSGYRLPGMQNTPTLTVDRVLEANKVAKALSSNDTLRGAGLRLDTDIQAFDSILQKLHDQIVNSAVFTDYKRKRTRALPDDVQMWATVIETILAKDPDVDEAMRKNESFTTQGKQMAFDAVLNTLRSYADSRQLLAKAKKDLQMSLDKAYELYLSLFMLIIDITREHEQRLENAKTKYLASAEDLNPNTRMIDNALVAYLEHNEDFVGLVKEYKVQSTTPTSTLVRSLLDKILKSELYARYMAEPVTDFANDVEFWRNVMRTIILPSDELAEDLEDRSVYWNDDLQIMGTFVLKTLKKIATSEGKPVEMLPKYKDTEDEKFGPDLFMYTLDNQDTYRGYIDRFVNSGSWDPERLAFMDIVIMETAIAEIVNYPKIPVPVTVNEYVEIANCYSSDKSGAFINGILFSVIKWLNEQGVIHKS